MEGLKAEVRLLDLLKTFFPDTLGGASLLVIKPTELLGDIESEKRVVLDTLAFIDEKTSPTVITNVSTAIAIRNVTRKFERM